MKRKLALIQMLIFFSAKFGLSQINLQSGLVASYELNGNTNDLSGNNFHAVPINGGSYTADRFGNPNSAYQFDGVDDYLRVTDNGSFSTPNISICFWFQTETNSLQCIVGKRQFETVGGSGGAQYQLAINYSPFPGVVSNLIGNNSTCTNIASSSYLNSNDWTCRQRWFFVAITFDGARHKVYINGILRVDRPTSFTSFLIGCNSELRFGNWWQGDLLPYKGKIDDVRWYNRAINEQEVVSLFGNYSPQASIDYAYTFENCSSNRLRFFSSDRNNNSQTWLMGDGTLLTGASVQHTYANQGNYNVQLVTNNGFGCFDTISKVLVVQRQNADIIANSVDTVCRSNPIRPRFNSWPIDYCWQGNFPLQYDNFGNSVLTPLNDTTIVVNALVSSNNLVRNGNFNEGNVGFSSSNTFSSSNSGQNQFFVVSNVSNWNNNFLNCDNVLQIGGNVLVQGAGAAATTWSQTVSVNPNSTYTFKVLARPVANNSVGTIGRLFINGKLLYSLQLPTNANGACGYTPLIVQWPSGSTNVAQLSMEFVDPASRNAAVAIDSIYFGTTTFLTDTVRIKVTTPPNINATKDTAVCKGEPLTLTATGASNFVWTQASNPQNSQGGNFISLFPSSSVSYIVTGFDLPNCAVFDTINISVNFPPILPPLADTSICFGSSLTLGSTPLLGVTYEWLDDNGVLLSGNANLQISPSVNSRYRLRTSSSTGCVGIDTVNVLVKNSVNQSKYLVANAFTPNADNLNDCFGLKFWDDLTKLDFAIFNRLGEVVFRTSDPKQCWDGTFKRVRQPAGTYVYRIVATNDCLNIERHGTLVLIR